jgi:cellulose synthase/poly-beta-1,6-N-acetylglucosamine synthase-like glycosyltransferase
MIITILLILGIVALIIEFLIIIIWIYPRWFYRKEKFYNYNPKTCVIVPCKGIEHKFRENIDSICNQNYEDYKVIFVTDSKDDPAYKLIFKHYKNNPKVKLETCEKLKSCSGKISALIRGIKVADDVEVYVFADSDVKPHKDWLKYLVNDLDEKNIGATTGYRWYFPHDIKSLIVSSWNLAGSLSLFFYFVNYAWGGSTAIKKDLFEKLDIESNWMKGYSDDLILTDCVKKGGYKIKYVPKCILESHFDGNFKSFLNFGTRQFTWVRWYYAPAWYFSVIGFVGLKTLTILGLILLILGFTIPGLIIISMILVEILSGWVAHSTMKKIMYYDKKKFGSSFHYAMMMPVSYFIFAYNNWSSIFKKELKWGGRIYKKPKKVKDI